jgi:serine protease Do
MKKANVILGGIGLAAAVFAGVLGALEVNNLVERNRTARILGSQPLDAANFRLASNEDVPTPPVDFRAAAKKVIPSVVSIDRLQRVGGFYDDGQIRETGSGSGVVLTADGVIVTNNHVVQGAEVVKVRMPDKRSFNARVLGRDPRSDLAVLKINATGLTPIQMGDSSRVEVGEWVMAVGNPLGFDSTVSIGVVSSLQRSLPVQGMFLLDAIQTDAAINPGNSGGALTDSQGRLIGINSAIASPSGASVGIGFAIPVNRARQIVNDIVQHGYARYAGLGIRYNPNWAQMLADPQARRELGQITGSQNVPSEGIIVKSPYRDVPSIEPGSAAERAGLREWDVLLEIDGKQISDPLTLNQVLTPKRPGDNVTVKFWQRGETKTARVELQEIRDRL